MAQPGRAETGTPSHIPVLLTEVVALLQPAPGGVFIDGTVGGGGHGEAILGRTAPDGRLLALDADSEAVAAAAERFAPFGTRVSVRHANFRRLGPVARAEGLSSVDGVLLDLGFSSDQIDSPGHGLSFNRDEPLDMRYDRTTGTSAAGYLASAPAEEIERVLREYGEEPRARRIAAEVVKANAGNGIHTTGQLARVVEQAVGGRRGHLHPATRTFQALRIAVNDELGALEEALPQAIELLRPGGRIAVIAFHSLEDRIVKLYFRKQAGRDPETGPRLLPVASPRPTPVIRIVTPHPVSPGLDEIARNPRSRSARLRVAEKL
jgi:16S rRNA (cytosine1402-N4)-methyltransferase